MRQCYDRTKLLAISQNTTYCQKKAPNPIAPEAYRSSFKEYYQFSSRKKDRPLKLAKNDCQTFKSSFTSFESRMTWCGDWIPTVRSKDQRKKTLNAIITKAYQSRCSSWKPISEARIVFQFVHPVNKLRQRKTSQDGTKLCHLRLSALAISKQVSRCCIKFPHELTCHFFTNQSIKKIC